MGKGGERMRVMMSLKIIAFTHMFMTSCTLTLSVGGAGGGNATLSGWNCFTATT